MKQKKKKLLSITRKNYLKERRQKRRKIKLTIHKKRLNTVRKKAGVIVKKLHKTSLLKIRQPFTINNFTKNQNELPKEAKHVKIIQQVIKNKFSLQKRTPAVKTQPSRVDKYRNSIQFLKTTLKKKHPFFRHCIPIWATDPRAVDNNHLVNTILGLKIIVMLNKLTKFLDKRQLHPALPFRVLLKKHKFILKIYKNIKKKLNARENIKNIKLKNSSKKKYPELTNYFNKKLKKLSFRYKELFPTMDTQESIRIAKNIRFGCNEELYFNKRNQMIDYTKAIQKKYNKTQIKTPTASTLLNLFRNNALMIYYGNVSKIHKFYIKNLKKKQKMVNFGGFLHNKTRLATRHTAQLIKKIKNARRKLDIRPRSSKVVTLAKIIKQDTYRSSRLPPFWKALQKKLFLKRKRRFKHRFRQPHFYVKNRRVIADHSKFTLYPKKTLKRKLRSLRNGFKNLMGINTKEYLAFFYKLNRVLGRQENFFLKSTWRLNSFVPYLTKNLRIVYRARFLKYYVRSKKIFVNETPLKTHLSYIKPGDAISFSADLYHRKKLRQQKDFFFTLYNAIFFKNLAKEKVLKINKHKYNKKKRHKTIRRIKKFALLKKYFMNFPKIYKTIVYKNLAKNEIFSNNSNFYSGEKAKVFLFSHFPDIADEHVNLTFFSKPDWYYFAQQASLTRK